MFDSLILSRKPKKTDTDGDSIAISAKTLTSVLGIRNQTISRVNEGEQTRPDLVSLRVYGTDSHQDEICKMNGISNPFALDTSDILLMPQPVSFSRNIIVDQSDAVQTQPKTSDFRLTFNNVSDGSKESEIQKFNKSFEKGVEELKKNGSGLPPTVADFGDKQFIVRGGKVIFAPNIGKCVTNDTQPISKGDLLAKLIKNRMNG